eukprot:617833-Alexandrium_andersonii.AAC.1
MEDGRHGGSGGLVQVEVTHVLRRALVPAPRLASVQLEARVQRERAVAFRCPLLDLIESVAQHRL